MQSTEIIEIWATYFFSCSTYVGFTVKCFLVLKPIPLTKNSKWQSLEIYAKYHLWII